jgi:hypothetical protein
MTYTLRIEPKASYLHAIVTGVNSLENVTGYLEELARECAARECFRVLIEERLEGPRLKTMDVFRVASQSGKPLVSEMRAIAFVDVNAVGDMMQFAEDVAVNRGLPVRMFRTVAQAEQWLVQAETSGGDPPLPPRPREQLAN